MNTRTHDLDILDQSRFITNSDDSRVHREALLEAVFAQSKDPHLEQMRSQLEQWIIRGLASVPDEGKVATKAQRKAMAEAEMKIQELEIAIKRYSSSPSFQAVIAKAVAKVSHTEAEILLKGKI